MDATTTATLRCTACGTLAPALCACGVAYAPYVAPGKLAEEAVKANPGKSARMIADELGIDEQTVRAARSTAGNPAVDGEITPQGVRGPDGVIRRLGRDGKWRRLPKKKPSTGRPRGRPPKAPGVKQAQRSIDIAPETWEEVKLRATQANMSAAQLIGQLLTGTTEIDPKSLSMTAQEKLAAAIRQADRKRQNEFEGLVRAEVTKRNEKAFPRLKEAQDKAYQTESAYRKFMDRQKKLGTISDWNNLVMCLHPDTRRTASDEKFDRAFAWVQSRKFAITGEEK